ncbi:protein 5NUC [Anopheles stephensi]|uniref:protein 5NUC n=1 Tax=Anopheles stephensi TaxID=30069 RepID=UPI0016589EC7|nr:protein 5NUC [Anopheles stephensi]XP_035900906.1 protein 5NUC [Anopheles stephensi]XP_035900907.1 protein 5NUC [Anopheles stephensi]
MARRLTAYVQLAVLLVATFTCGGLAAPKAGDLELIILHNNDMHARFEQTGAHSNECQPSDVASNRCYGGFARVAHKVREYRAAEASGGLPVLYLNAGDTYTGTPWFSVYKDNITAAFLNMLKPDAISLGNHEFDLGVEGLVPFLNEVDFPVLVTNLDLSKTPEMQSTKSLQRSVIFTKAGVRIGVIGYLTPETKQLSPINTVEFLDEIEAINKEATALKEQGVHILIALGHSGLERDKEIAARCPDVDLVIGGHSHTFLYSGSAPDVEEPAGPYPVMVKNAAGKDVPVVQAYAYTKYLGYLHLMFDAEGNLIELDGSPLLLNGTVQRDSDVLQLLELYRPGIVALDEQIGRSNVFLDSSRCRFEECNIGNMIADSLVITHATTREQSNDGYWTDAAIGFIQGGGIRASINAGPITMKDLKTVLPFGNAMVVTEITGTQLRQMLETSVHRYDGVSGYGEFLQMAGVNVEYDLARPPMQRVLHVKVRCARCQVPAYEDLKDDEHYRVLLSQFLYDGGDGYDMLPNSPKELLTFGEYEITEEYLKRYSPIYPAIEWRIRMEGQPAVTTTDGPGAGTTTMMTTSTTEDSGAARVYGVTISTIGMMLLPVLLTYV